jgi:hypothetical protein
MTDARPDDLVSESCSAAVPHQPLHLVFGGELVSLDAVAFRDLSAVDMVGVFEDYEAALSAWRSKAQKSVDEAQVRYFIVALHRLLSPDVPQGNAGR